MAIEERFNGANHVEAGRKSPYWGEHAARYMFAESFIADKVVLDIACGTGYGIGLLSEKAGSIVGVDVDVESAVQAKSECGSNASVVLGDGVRLPFSDRTFDVITSFETLEHLHERSLFLMELHRVLRPDGALILSTPNAAYTMPLNGKPANPFHIFEYLPDELRSELEGYFHIKEFLGQILDIRIRIPPFHESQKRLPKDIGTRAMLLGWRVMNKIPLTLREPLSDIFWGRPFYPTENDYQFSNEAASYAPVLLAVCRKKEL